MDGSIDQLTHEVKIYTVVNKIIHPRFYALGCAEIDPIQLANSFDLFPSPCQANKIGVEFLQIGLENRGGIASRIACYEDRKKRRIRCRSRRYRSGDQIKHLRHFVELFGANIGAMGKAKIYL